MSSFSVRLVKFIEVHFESQELQVVVVLVSFQLLIELIEGRSVIFGQLVKLVACLRANFGASDHLLSIIHADPQILSLLELLDGGSVEDILNELEFVDQLKYANDVFVNLHSTWTEKSLVKQILHEFLLDGSDLIKIFCRVHLLSEVLPS